MPRTLGPLGEIVRRERLERGLTYRELGARVGASASTLHGIEHGHRMNRVNAWLVYGLAREFGMRMETLLDLPELECEER